MDALQLKMPGFSELPESSNESLLIHALPKDQIQSDLEKSAAKFLRVEFDLHLDETLVLVACCKQKQSVAARAEDLYTSPLFRQSMSLATRLHLKKCILSAMHGLVNVDRFVSPYNLSLKDSSPAEQVKWSQRVFAEIKEYYPVVRRIVILAGSTYSKTIIPSLEASGIEVVNPLQGLSMGWRLAFLKHCHRILDRRETVSDLYAQIQETALRKGTLLPLSEALAHPVPQQGVYFFFDPEEPTSLSRSFPRMVRIGTHGVSKGSKATLRTRLRTHLGTSAGLGNHRASVFRLHVGQAMILRDGLQHQFPEWGKGQSSTAASALAERDLEQAVSRYISRLLMANVEIADEASKSSLRAILESNSIAAFTEHGINIEQPSSSWLGNWSAQKSIRNTGLWNVRHVGDEANLKNIRDILRGETPKLRRRSLISHPNKAQRFIHPKFPDLLGN